LRATWQGHLATVSAIVVVAIVTGAPGRGLPQTISPVGKNPLQDGGAADNQPVQIQADNGVEWQQDSRVYIARGNAVATRGPSEVHADTLIAHYREAKGGNSNTGGNTEIYRVEAEGHVTMKRETQTVVGDRAVYDVDQQVAVVTGKNLKMTTTTDTVTARDSMEWYDQKQVAVARGNAVAIRNDRMVKGDVLTAYMKKTAAAPAKGGATVARGAPAQNKLPVRPASASLSPGTTPGAGDSESRISRMDAQGHVVVSNPLETGRGDFGVYNADTGIATLIGNVVIERGKDVIRGQRGVMDLNSNIARMLPGNAPGVAAPRVQGLFARQQQTSPSAATTPASNHKTP
jgi:lipopolysaccharide export system protein LptA